MKKILFVTDSFLPLVDGVSRFSCDLLNTLSKDFEFRLLAPDYGLRLNNYNGIRISYFKTNKLFKIKAGQDYYPTAPNFFRIMSEVKKADAVFVQTLPYLGAMTILAAKLQKKPVAMYFHQIGWEQLKLVTQGPAWFKNLIRRFALGQIRYYCNLCSIILVPSSEIMGILDDAGINAEKAVVNLGVDTKRFVPSKNKAAAKKKLGINPKSTVIGYCGRMSEEKDVPTLIRAFLRLSEKKNNLFLLLVGGGEIFEKYTLTHRNIKITGFVTDVVPYYNAMDIYVMPSLTETTGLSTVEAMSSGIPVITTPVGIAMTGISSGYNGMIFSKGNDAELEAQLETLLASRAARQKLSKNARKSVLDNYSWDKTAKEIKEILGNL